MSTIFKVTGYCPYKIFTGKSSDVTASGKMPKANHTIAAPNKYPFGKRIVLDGYGTFYVEDRGGSIHNNGIERFFNTRQEVVNWGIKMCKGTVYV